MSDQSPAELHIRPYADADEPAVLALLQASLGWVPDAQYGAFFRWKHLENPFGRSPAWVAVDGDRVVGFRIFLCWEFTRGGVAVRAVRAVDTATHPDYQGRGIFSRLTRHALEALRAQQVAFVFNTPNAQSRPGYLKMGWQLVERMPVLARPRSPRSLLAIARARVPADKWSEPTDAGVPAPDAFRDATGLDELLAARSAGQTSDSVLRTHRSCEFYAWRYGFGPLAYRVLLAGDRIGDGFVVFRLRRRGPAMEAAVCDVVLPEARRGQLARVLRDVVKSSRADYAVRIGGAHAARAGFLPLPGEGPTLVWRAVNETVMPTADAWDLALGDIELF